MVERRKNNRISLERRKKNRSYFYFLEVNYCVEKKKNRITKKRIEVILEFLFFIFQGKFDNTLG